MLTGRVSYGFGRLGQEPTDTSVMSAFPTPLSESSLTQTPIAQWTTTDFAAAAGLLFAAYAVFATGKRGVRRTTGFLQQRKVRKSKQHQALSDYYRA